MLRRPSGDSHAHLSFRSTDPGDANVADACSTLLVRMPMTAVVRSFLKELLTPVSINTNIYLGIDLVCFNFPSWWLVSQITLLCCHSPYLLPSLLSSLSVLPLSLPHPLRSLFPCPSTSFSLPSSIMYVDFQAFLTHSPTH